MADRVARHRPLVVDGAYPALLLASAFALYILEAWAVFADLSAGLTLGPERLNRLLGILWRVAIVFFLLYPLRETLAGVGPEIGVQRPTRTLSSCSTRASPTAPRASSSTSVVSPSSAGPHRSRCAKASMPPTSGSEATRPRCGEDRPRPQLLLLAPAQRRERGRRVAIQRAPTRRRPRGPALRRAQRPPRGQPALSNPRRLAGCYRAGARIPLKTIRRFRPDIVHIHNLFPNFGRRCVEDINVPVVHTVHNYRPLCANGLLFFRRSALHRLPGRQAMVRIATRLLSQLPSRHPPQRVGESPRAHGRSPYSGTRTACSC